MVNHIQVHRKICKCNYFLYAYNSKNSPYYLLFTKYSNQTI